MHDIHSFDVGVAQTLGVRAALIIWHLQSQIAEGRCRRRDGRIWVRATVGEIAYASPYLSALQARRQIDNLMRSGVLIPFDDAYQDRWVAFADEATWIRKGQMKFDADTPSPRPESDGTAANPTPGPLRHVMKMLEVLRADTPPGEGEIWNRSGQKGAALRILRILWTNAHRCKVRFKTKQLAELAGVGSQEYVVALLKKLEAAREIELVYKPSRGKRGNWIYRLTPSRAVVPPAGPRRRRRKPRAQFVLFRDTRLRRQRLVSTAVRVPREINHLVVCFQDVVWQLEPALQTRPNVASTAGWLLREGVRFAARNRVHGLGRAAAPAEDYVSLEIHVDRKTWRAVRRAVVMSERVLETAVPRLIELGAQMCPLPEAGARRETEGDTVPHDVDGRRRTFTAVRFAERVERRRASPRTVATAGAHAN